MNFEKSWDTAVKTLSDNKSSLGCIRVEKGKPGYIPQESPFILVFATPERCSVYENSELTARRLTLSVFCGDNHYENDFAVVTTYYTAEKALGVLTNTFGVRIAGATIEIDSVFDDLTVCLLELTVFCEADFNLSKTTEEEE